MKPYYDDGTVTIYHGDCREVAPRLWADVLVTDPPYGIGLGIRKDQRAGRLARLPYASGEDTYEDYLLGVVPVIRCELLRMKRAAVFTGPHYHELPKADAIGGIYCPSGTGRNKWGFKTFLPILLYGTAPFVAAGKGNPHYVLRSTESARKNGHPCPKPLGWMRWLVQLVSLPGETLLDPFAGSGTTLRAAKDCGRKAIGIEIDERYCEIAAQFCAQEVLDLEREGMTTTLPYTETPALTRRLAQELADCGHDITTVDLLDALATAGLALTADSDASQAYFQELEDSDPEANAENARAAWQSQCEAAEAEAARLRDGLRHYADMDNWDMADPERWVWVAEYPPYLRADALLADQDGAA